MAELAASLLDIDAEIVRLHRHAVAEKTEELAAMLDLAQIDALLERRHRLVSAGTSRGTAAAPRTRPRQQRRS